MNLRRPLWHQHPRVRTGEQLTLGERAADVLKHWFGSWTFLGILNGVIVAWIAVQSLLRHSAFDPFPYILLNLGLSWLAAQQGGALQISANRGDRISSEVALSTHENTEAIKALAAENKRLTEQVIDMTEQQTAILTELRELRRTVQPRPAADDSSGP